MPSFGLSGTFGKRQSRANFERQIQQQLPILFRVARGITDQASDAEDLVHDSCVKALSSFDSTNFSSEVSLGAWLKRILVNTYRDHYRRAQRSPVRPLEYHATSDETRNVVELVVSTDLSPLESMQNRDSTSAIHNAFSTLPPEVRVVSVLFLINGLSYKDIASITDCPIGTVMSRLARGREILKEKLSAYDPGGDSSSTACVDRGDKA